MADSSLACRRVLTIARYVYSPECTGSVHRMSHQKWKYSRLIELIDSVRDYRADGVDGPQEMELK